MLTGLVVAVGIGLILGILIGACLLAIVIHCQKRLADIYGSYYKYHRNGYNCLVSIDSPF